MFSDSEETVPTLQYLACHQFARWLCQEQTKNCCLPTDSHYFEEAFFDNFKDEILTTLSKNNAFMPTVFRIAIAEQVESIMQEMKNELSHLDLIGLLDCMLKKPKWHDFVFLWWCCFWREAGDEMFLTMFERVMEKSEELGLHTIPEDELSSYIKIWKSASKRLKLKVFENLSRSFTKKGKFRPTRSVEELFGLQRDLEFLMKLFEDFDLSDRLQIWIENWQDLIYGVSPTHLEPFMEMCCESDDDEAFREFKKAWLSKREIIEDYYCMLIDRFCVNELDDFMYFYASCSSSDEEVLQLAQRIIHTYFVLNPLPKSYEHLLHIAQSDAWFGEAIRMPELEYLMRVEVIKMKKYCHFLIQKARFNEIPYLLNYFLPKKEAKKYEKQFTKSFFFETSAVFDQIFEPWMYSDIFRKPIEFDTFIKRVFPSTKEAANFKKKMIYSQNTINAIRSHLSASEKSDADNFVRVCLCSEQEISDWEDTMLRDTVWRIRNSLDLGDAFSRLTDIIAWCTGTEERTSEFKSLLPIDEAFEIIARCSSSRNGYDVGLTRFFDFDRILKLWYPEIEDRVNFKMQKLRDYLNDDSVLEVMLLTYKNDFVQCGTDDERREVVVSSCQH
ncbi:uncharacterized protein LOC135831758 isoform X2 [Planococcus citri]|uniref:uncharacterized protein LOC135831758 isoform X2 n=1 Tax=Planococcus citri TaxID=170843 RepID=UPI0031F7F543